MSSNSIGFKEILKEISKEKAVSDMDITKSPSLMRRLANFIHTPRPKNLTFTTRVLNETPQKNLNEMHRNREIIINNVSKEPVPERSKFSAYADDEYNSDLDSFVE